jgi:gluconate:H+ symporter, GntP family
MTTSFIQLIIFLLAGIALIILFTAKFRVHAFFALLLACFLVGFGVQLSAASILATIGEGFGHIMQSLGLIIVLGTTLGVLLEHSGCTRVMADFVMSKTGKMVDCYVFSPWVPAQ